MKKLISIVLALAMLLSCCSALAETVAFNDPAAVKPESIGEYPVTGLSWSATTDVRANEPYTIAMIVKNNTNPFMNGVLNGFAKAAKDVGFEAVLLSPQTADSNEDQVRLVEDMIQKGVDASFRRLRRPGTPASRFWCRAPGPTPTRSTAGTAPSIMTRRG